MDKALGIIDYGAGNLSSVCNSFRANGTEAKLVRTVADLEGLSHLVLPGVGAFGDCVKALREQGLDTPIRNWIAGNHPFLGICVGYQVLFESGEESPGVPGLGVFRGQVCRFPEGELKIPHMGWNNVTPTQTDDPLFAGMGKSPYFYFVHSYFPRPLDSALISSTTQYGVNFAASLRCGRVFATQFHPEKSQQTGLKLLENFMAID